MGQFVGYEMAAPPLKSGLGIPKLGQFAGYESAEPESYPGFTYPPGVGQFVAYETATSGLNDEFVYVNVYGFVVDSAAPKSAVGLSKGGVSPRPIGITGVAPGYGPGYAYGMAEFVYEMLLRSVFTSAEMFELKA